MHAKSRLLIFPGEAENAFELYQSLRYSTRFEVWGASSRPGCANTLFPRYKDNLPSIHDAGFLSAFSAFLLSHRIAFILPTHDDAALFLAEHQSALHAKLIGSNVRCAQLCRDKQQLYAALAQAEFCPVTFEKPEQVDRWPVFIKPRKGQGGVGGYRVDDAATLAQRWSDIPEPVICEYLPGEEYTVDCFSDQHGHLRFAAPRSRDVIKMGVAFVSRSMPADRGIQSIAELLNANLRPRGCWFFQVKRSVSGTLKMLEVSCRPATGLGLYRHMGVNLPLLAAYDALGLEVTPLVNDLQITMHRRLRSSYSISHAFDTVYVDYDDTLIVDGQVNAVLMQFLYASRNQGKNLILLSRHPGDLRENMRIFCIPERLFQQIIHLTQQEKKSAFITTQQAIFIDNLFSERDEVLHARGIPVFDVDAIEELQ